MAELLVKAIDSVHADPETDRRVAHRKGDIIAIMPDGHPWGARETPPRFVVVRCPGLDVDLVRDRVDAWRYEIAFTVVGSDLAIDGHRIRASNTNAGASGSAGLTLAPVQAFLERWGATVVFASAGAVTFDVRIFDAATSPAFWDRPLAGLVFSQDGYAQASGVHTITMDYSAHPGYAADPGRFAQLVRIEVEQRATFLAEAAGAITFQVTRAAVRERFRADVTERLGIYQRHRYYFAAADVDTALGMGGVVTLTQSQLATRIIDRVAE